jgi:hypothetical protein
VTWVISPIPLWEKAQQRTVYAVRNGGSLRRVACKSSCSMCLQSAVENRYAQGTTATLVHKYLQEVQENLPKLVDLESSSKQ